MIDMHLSVLAQLAHIDNDFDQREKDMIFKVGRAHSMSNEQIEAAIDNASHASPPALDHLSDEERFEFLCNIVQLMKIDGRTFNGEILYCQDIASKLGYNPDVIMELHTMIFTNPDIHLDQSLLKQKIRLHLDSGDK